jgi:hypothetical protein
MYQYEIWQDGHKYHFGWRDETLDQGGVASIDGRLASMYAREIVEEWLEESGWTVSESYVVEGERFGKGDYQFIVSVVVDDGTDERELYCVNLKNCEEVAQ